MSYYHIDGVSGVFATPESSVHEQSRSWRLALASIFLVVSVITSGVAMKVFASVEPTEIELPKVNAVMQPAPQPEAPVVLANTTPSKLQTELEAWSLAKKTDAAFYVQSLDTGEVLADVSSEKQYQMASIYKIFLLQPLAKKLPAESWANSTITEKSYLSCVTAMLAVSDNPCAEAIAARLGWTAVHKQVQAAGYKKTVLNSTDTFHSSAADAALLLDRLYHGDGYDAKTKGIALEALAKRKGNEAVRRGCQECTVYNKTGDLNGYKHDAAIVEKNGKAYVVVIFSVGSTWSQLTEAARIVDSYL